jgi:hypothetical protein
VKIHANADLHCWLGESFRGERGILVGAGFYDVKLPRKESKLNAELSLHPLFVNFNSRLPFLVASSPEIVSGNIPEVSEKTLQPHKALSHEADLSC